VARVVRFVTEVAEALVGVDEPSADGATAGGTVTETAAHGKSNSQQAYLNRIFSITP